jgi:hypothetical protein
VEVERWPVALHWMTVHSTHTYVRVNRSYPTTCRASRAKKHSVVYICNQSISWNARFGRRAGTTGK